MPKLTNIIDKSTAAVAINKTLKPGKPFALKEVRIHLSGAGGAGNLTITVSNSRSSAYNHVLKTQDMTSVTDLVWQPDNPMEFNEYDSIVVAWANASTRTYGLDIVYDV